jgi:hypothetical protein
MVLSFPVMVGKRQYFLRGKLTSGSNFDTWLCLNFFLSQLIWYLFFQHWSNHRPWIMAFWCSCKCFLKLTFQLAMAFQFACFLATISFYQEDILALSNEFSDDFRFVFIAADCFIAFSHLLLNKSFYLQIPCQPIIVGCFCFYWL